MKTLVCEMCESTDFAKADGMFVCQNCGMKYSVEEAKKLMIEVENTAAPATAAPAAQSSELENLYQIARRAKDDGNSENAAKFYEQVLMRDPTSWEANFYTVYYQSMSCKIAHIQSASNKLENCLDSVLSLVSESKNDKITVLSELGEKLSVISRMLFNAAENHYNGIGDSIRANYTQELINNCCAARDILYTFGNTVEKYFDEDICKAVCPSAWQTAITLHERIIPRMANAQLNRMVITDYYGKIVKYDESYRAKYNEYKKNSLRERIRNIDNQIKVEEKSTKGGCLGGATFFFIIAAIMFACGATPGLSWAYLVGGLEIVIALILCVFPKATKTKEEADKAIETLKANKATIEKEIEELE